MEEIWLTIRCWYPNIFCRLWVVLHNHESDFYLYKNLKIFKFLCSIFVLNSVVIPALWWILPGQCSQFVSHELCDLGGTLKFYSFLRLALIQLCYVSVKCTTFKVHIDHTKYFVVLLSKLILFSIITHGFSLFILFEESLTSFALNVCIIAEPVWKNLLMRKAWKV